jgi:Protein of unknown function (DUF2892)
MKKNVGSFDGFFRMLLAMIIIMYAVLAGPWWIGLIAIIPILTAAAFYCPILDLMGISTNHEG